MTPLNTEDWPKLLRPGSRIFIGGDAFSFSAVDQEKDVALGVFETL
jgi:hypothetical protein